MFAQRVPQRDLSMGGRSACPAVMRERRGLALIVMRSHWPHRLLDCVANHEALIQAVPVLIAKSVNLYEIWVASGARGKTFWRETNDSRGGVPSSRTTIRTQFCVLPGTQKPTNIALALSPLGVSST